MIRVECQLTVAQTKGIHNKGCIYFPVFTGKEHCWHYLKDPGTQSDAPQQCPRLRHRQRTMPRKPTA